MDDNSASLYEIMSRILGGANDDDSLAAAASVLVDIFNRMEVQAQIDNIEEQAAELWKKYEDLGNIDDLNTTILLEKEAINLAPEDDGRMPGLLNNLAISLETRFDYSEDLDDLQGVIALRQRIIELTPGDDDRMQGFLNNLAISLKTRFDYLKDLDDLQEVITLQQNIIELTPEDETIAPHHLVSLANHLRARFDESKQVVDLEIAISFLEQAIKLTPDGHASESELRAACLVSLGNAFRSRFQWFDQVTDIDHAIQVQQQAVDLTPDNYADSKHSYLTSLGILFHDRFVRFGEVADIEHAIQVLRQAVDLTPDTHPSKSYSLAQLGNSLADRFRRLGGEVADIDHAIQVQQQAVNLAPGGHISKRGYLINLGNSLFRRFDCFGEVADIDSAIQVQQQAVDLTPDSDASKPSYLTNLGLSFRSRFDCLGEVTDIEHAIQLQQRSINLIPDSYADKSIYLNNLGCSFQSRFERFGKVVDIDNAIQVQQHAVDLTPNNHSDKPDFLTRLGGSFHRRFEWFGEVADIDHAIQVQQLAVDLAPDEHANKPMYLSALGSSLCYRFQQSSEAAVIDHAIRVQEQAANLTPNYHPTKPACLSNLGASLQSRFESLGKVADMDQAIQVHQQAVGLTPDSHASKPMFLTNLGFSLQSRFELFGEMADIERTIQVLQQAVDLTPDGHASKPIYLHNLGAHFSIQFDKTSNINHLQHAISAYSDSASSLAGSPRLRLKSAHRWATLASTHPLYSSSFRQSALQASRTLMELVPRVVWLGNSVSLRYQDITLIGGFVGTAASIACSFGYHDLAVEWIEQGRSIVWSQMLHLRTPLDHLQHDYPMLASSLQDISSRIELIGTLADTNNQTSIASSNSNSNNTSLEQTAQEHRRLAEEWEDLLQQVRRCSGYERFLLPKMIAELALAATSGPIIFVNVEEDQCDALILQNIKGSPEVDHIPLSLLSLDKIQSAYNFFAHYLSHDGFKARTSDIHHLSSSSSLQAPVDDVIDRASYAVHAQGDMQDVLEMLWDIIVEPVFIKLGYQCQTSNYPKDSLPHITWCTTGPLAFLPLHAAGRYSSSTETAHERTYNYVVSSYAPSISTLIKQSNINDLGEFYGLTAISQPSTANNRVSQLPGTLEEVSKIQDLFRSHKEDFTWLNASESIKSTVLEKMSQSSWLHLACHGIQKKDNPMESAFILYDDSLDLHTISQKTLPNARLAFLSACQTATGDEKLPNEAAHLAAGLLMAGYHSVVGTMWSIKDQDAPLVAEEFYKYLIDHEMKTDKGEAAYALHKAVGQLRDGVGANQFARWVPFIHLGI